MPGYFEITKDLILWGDHMPALGLDIAPDLDLNTKREWLFGRNTIDDALSQIPLDCAVLFDHYLNISLTSSRQTIFLPWFFLRCCVDYADFTTSDHLPKKHVPLVCPMNKKRYARVLASCWLANHEKEINLHYTQNWDTCDDVLYELVQLGGLKDWTGEWGPEIKTMPRQFFGDYGPNHLNYKNIFKDIYENSASVIVLEPVFWEYGSILTEKYLQAVLGGCIPLVNGYKIYDHLESIGFETFGDIIDQSSQYEKNSVLAVWYLMDKNIDFFQSVIDIYHEKSVRERLLHNINHAKNYRLLYKNMLENLNTDSGKELFDRYKKEILDVTNFGQGSIYAV
jgi:hypothetical protein